MRRLLAPLPRNPERASSFGASRRLTSGPRGGKRGDMGMRRTFFSVTAFALAAASCARKPADLTPDGAVRELLDRIDRTESDPTEMHGVYELLSADTKAK